MKHRCQLTCSNQQLPESLTCSIFNCVQSLQQRSVKTIYWCLCAKKKKKEKKANQMFCFSLRHLSIEDVKTAFCPSNHVPSWSTEISTRRLIRLIGVLCPLLNYIPLISDYTHNTWCFISNNMAILSQTTTQVTQENLQDFVWWCFPCQWEIHFKHKKMCCVD